MMTPQNETSVKMDDIIYKNNFYVRRVIEHLSTYVIFFACKIRTQVKKPTNGRFFYLSMDFACKKI